MDSLHELIYTKYIKYITGLNWGKADQDYTTLYNLILYIKFKIDRPPTFQFLKSNLY